MISIAQCCNQDSLANMLLDATLPLIHGLTQTLKVLPADLCEPPAELPGVPHLQRRM